MLAAADGCSYRAAGARCWGRVVGDAAQLGGASWAAGAVLLHGDKAVWKLVDREPERFRSRARPRGVDTWEGSAAVRCVLGLGAARRCSAYPPM